MPITLNHRREGTGDPVVLLHPVGLDLTFWGGVVPALAEHFTVVRFDLAGHGGSPPASPGHSLGDYAADVRQTMAAIELNRAAVVGLSFGGMVAQLLALEHPEAVTALVLCGCPSGFEPAARERLIDRGARAERGGMEAVVEETLTRWFTPGFLADGHADAVRTRLLTEDVAGWATSWRALARLDTTARLREVGVPVLCIAGELDASIAPDVMRRVAEAFGSAEYVVLSGAPHMMHIQSPAQFSTAVARFLVSPHT